LIFLVFVDVDRLDIAQFLSKLYALLERGLLVDDEHFVYGLFGMWSTDSPEGNYLANCLVPGRANLPCRDCKIEGKDVGLETTEQTIVKRRVHPAIVRDLAKLAAIPVQAHRLVSDF
jgi:hypothetical protein